MKAVHSSQFTDNSKNTTANCKLATDNSKGLTLIEILVAMGIAAVVGVLLVVVIVSSAGLFSNQSSKVQTGLNSNDVLTAFRSSIKQANAVASQFVSGQTTYTTGVSQLVLQVPAIDSSNNIISNTYDYFVFYLDQNYLHFKVFPDVLSSRETTDRIFSNSVDSFKLQYFNSATPPVEVSPISAARVRMSVALKQSIATSEANLRND